MSPCSRSMQTPVVSRSCKRHQPTPLPLGLAVDRTGQFLYVTTVDDSVDAYSISSSGTLTRQTASDFNTGCPPLVHCGFLTAIVADPTADLLFVVVGGTGAPARVYALTIDPSDWDVDERRGASPFLAGGQLPTAIAVGSCGHVRLRR